jgi:hypothetical protein
VAHSTTLGNTVVLVLTPFPPHLSANHHLQHDARKATMPAAKVGKEIREVAVLKQYISTEHEKDLYGRGSPAPNTYNVAGAPGMGSQFVSPDPCLYKHAAACCRAVIMQPDMILTCCRLGLKWFLNFPGLAPI